LESRNGTPTLAMRQVTQHGEGRSRLLKRLIWGRNPRRTLLRAALLAATAFVLFRFLLLPVQVRGQSMWPTYRDRSWNFVNRLAYWGGAPRRGDVVCIRFTAGEHILILKRVVGLPGEAVAFRAGRLFINGQPIEEPYVRTPCDWDEPERRLGPDEYYVVGDNRAMPAADHWHGITDRWRIVGKVLR